MTAHGTHRDDHTIRFCGTAVTKVRVLIHLCLLTSRSTFAERVSNRPCTDPGKSPPPLPPPLPPPPTVVIKSLVDTRVRFESHRSIRSISSTSPKVRAGAIPAGGGGGGAPIGRNDRHCSQKKS